MKIQAKKSLGQHFLFNQIYLDKIIQHSLKNYDDMHSLNIILEIGPGLGTLTEKIRQAAFPSTHMICIEKDKELHQRLLNRWSNITFLLADALNVDFLDLNNNDNLTLNDASVNEISHTHPYKTTVILDESSNLQQSIQSSKHHQSLYDIEHCILIANLPYNISAPLIVKFLEKPFAKRYCILVQKEMAQRVCSKVGEEHYGRLAVLSQAYCDVRMCFDIHGDIFKPKTKVMSSFLIIEPFMKHYLQTDYTFQTLDKILRICFAQRRKMLSNVVPRELHSIFIDLGINMQQRAEQISVELYRQLAIAIDAKQLQFRHAI